MSSDVPEPPRQSRNARLRELSLRIFYQCYAYLLEVDAEIEEHLASIAQIRQISRQVSLDYFEIKPEDLRRAHLERLQLVEQVYGLLPEKLYLLWTARADFEADVLRAYKEEDISMATGDATPIPEGYLWDQVWTGGDPEERVLTAIAQSPRSIVCAFASFFERAGRPLPDSLLPFIEAAKHETIILPTTQNIKLALSGSPALVESLLGSPCYKEAGAGTVPFYITTEPI